MTNRVLGRLPETLFNDLTCSLWPGTDERDATDSGCINSSGIAVTVVSDW